MFCMDLKTNINFSIYSIKYLVFTIRRGVYCAERTGTLTKILVHLSLYNSYEPTASFASNSVDKILSFKFVRSSSCKEVACPLWRQKLLYNIQNDVKITIQPSPAMDRFL